MNDLATFLPSLQKALDEQQFEAVLNALAVDAIARSGDAADQGNLTGNAALDAVCAKAAAAIAMAYPSATPAEPVDKGLTLYIATDLYWGHGGHTPLLLDLIHVDRSERKELLLTLIGGGAQTPDFFHKLRQALPENVPVHPLQAATLLEKVLILRSYIQKRKPHRIILVTHQYDTVVYCALTADCAPQIINVHHADTFTLGLHIPWYVLIGLNYFSAQTVSKATGRGMFYWPLAAQDFGVRPWREWLAGEALHTCSHGSARKFDGKHGIDYEEILVVRLSMLPGDHYHIGDLSEERLLAIARRISDSGLDAKRFIYVGLVSSLWQYLKSSAIQLCISSFPVCGPKGIVETKGCGIPVLIFEDTENPVRSSSHYCYEQCLRWRTAEDLRSVFRSLTPDILRSQAKMARADYDRRHSMKSLGESAIIPDNFIIPGTHRISPR